jgi:hypothetical protein
MVNNSHQHQQPEQSYRFKVTVRFVDICGIVDHHCLEMIVRFVDVGVNC